MPHPSFARGAGALPPQAFFASPGQRVGLASKRFFGDGQRPTGLVNESVLRRVSRLSVSLAEGAVSTNTLAVVVETGSVVTVLGAEHDFACVQSLHCAASAMRDGRGRVAWLNGTAQKMLGLRSCGSSSELDAEPLLGATLAERLVRGTSDEARPLRLRHGLTVRLRAQRPAGDGLHRVIALSAAPTATPAIPEAAPATAQPAPAATLHPHTRGLIERTLADNAGITSRTVRRLGVSRSLPYRRLREWRSAVVEPAAPSANADRP